MESRIPETGTDDVALISMAAGFTVVVQSLVSVDSVRETLTRIVEFSLVTVEGCEFAGIFATGDPITAIEVCTDPLVAQVDALQHLYGEGPCLDAISQATFFYADEIGGDRRWPTFGPHAAASGMRSMLAFPLSTSAAITLCSRYPQAFGMVDRARGALLASLASFASSAARAHEDELRRYDNLQGALITRELVGQAQGILMERERLTKEQAFHVLRQASQHLNRKLREVALELIETGERPDTGGPSGDSQ